MKAATRVLALLTCLSPLPAASTASELTLGIANSTCTSMQEVGKRFSTKTGIELHLLCHPSGLLAKGIIEGALEIDYFLSANKDWMNKVREAGLIEPEAIQKNWGNVLVIASVPIKAGELRLTALSELGRPEVQHILMGDPKIAPYGQYAKEALLNAGLWERLQPKLKYNKKISLSVRTLKKYGLSRTGVVAFLYQTNVSGRLFSHFVVPQHLYSPIHYYSGPLSNSKRKEALAQFLDFVTGDEATRIFKEAGFIIHR